MHDARGMIATSERLSYIRPEHRLWAFLFLEIGNCDRGDLVGRDCETI